jgi:tripartite-type tricarboxylate transporter receptor subunit TctC
VMTEDVKARINQEGGDPIISTPDEYTADIAREATKWGGLIKKLNLRVN